MTTSAAVQRVINALEAHGCAPKWSGTSVHAKCPAHDDRRDSLSVSEGRDGDAVIYCHAGCTKESPEPVLIALGLTMADLFERRNGHGPAKRREVCAYPYHDEAGKLLFEVVRFEPKDFRPRRPDGAGGVAWDLKGVRRVLYRLRDVISTVADGGTIYVVEGERDADTLNGQPDAGNIIATTNPGGALKWRPEYSEFLRGAPVVIVADKDEPGRKHAREVAESLQGIAASVRIVEAKEGKDAADHLAAGFTLEEFVPVEDEQTERIPQIALAEAMKPFAKWLRMPLLKEAGTPDMGAVLFVFGLIAANRMNGDPVWGLLIGAPSSGKTEILSSTGALPDVHPAATITEAALLSGTPKREALKDAKGGLLRTIGDFGIIVCKDFGSIINQQKDTQAQTLAALREIFDGSWTRHVGTDGGRTLHWSGKIGLVGGATPAIDRRHAVMGTMGERFIFYRLTVEDDAALARAALDHIGQESKMRAELSGAASALFAGLDFTRNPRALTEAERERLVSLSSFIVRCRSAVERDGYNREIDLIPDPEAPGRLCLVLARLLAGLDLIGLDRDEAWRVVQRVGLDSMPALRRRAIHILAEKGTLSTTALALAAQYPSNTARRQLEELACFGVVDRESNGQGKTDTWTLTEWARRHLQTLTVPEIPGGLYEARARLNTPTRIASGKSGTPTNERTDLWS